MICPGCDRTAPIIGITGVCEDCHRAGRFRAITTTEWADAVSGVLAHFARSEVAYRVRPVIAWIDARRARGEDMIQVTLQFATAGVSAERHTVDPQSGETVRVEVLEKRGWKVLEERS